MTTKLSLPKFSSLEEEALFWDTHDITDYTHEMRPVQVQFAKQLSEGLTIRLSPSVFTKVREEAQHRGLKASTLVRMWIMERIHAAGVHTNHG